MGGKNQGKEKPFPKNLNDPHVGLSRTSKVHNKLSYTLTVEG